MSKTTNVIVATIAGFVAGILLAPKSGKQTRQDLKNKAHHAKQYADDKAVQVKGAIHDGVDSLKQGVDKAGLEAKGMASSARTSAATVGKEAAKLGDEAKLRASRVADEAKRTAERVQADIKHNVK